MFSITAIASLVQSFLGFGDTVKSITENIARVKIAQREAETNEQKIEAEAEIEALKLRRDVLVAEAPGSRVNQLFRVCLSIPALVLLAKIEIWDRALGLGSTPRLSAEEWAYIMMVCGFYLLNRTIQVARK